MMTLSKQAWDLSSQIIISIKEHPFNQELMQGSLDRDIFAYYIEQDSLYLQDFARCHAVIASKAPLKYVRKFLNYAEETFIAEQEVVHQFFKKKMNLSETKLLAPATLSYTNYLLRTCLTEPVEVGIAALLPCFWAYRDIGLFIAQQSAEENPYERWIETYSGDAFAHSVKQIIDIFDTLALDSSEKTKEKMLDVFYKSTCLEWHFWNDAYHRKGLDGFIMNNTDGRDICAASSNVGY